MDKIAAFSTYIFEYQLPEGSVIESESQTQVLQTIKDTTTGGVTFIKKYGKSKIRAKIDRNSMYPDIMVKYPLPTGSCVRTIP